MCSWRNAKKNLTRSQIHRLVEEGYVLLNGSVAKPSRKLRPGDRVSLTVPPPRSVELLAKPIPLNIHYQDPELLVVDKPAGMPVHPSPGHPSRTLVNALLALCPDLKGIGGEARPGIVHRLDKDTSGLMVVAKTGRAHAGISQQFKGRAIRKGYLALARGHIKPADGTIAGPIGRDPRNRKRMAVVAGGRTPRRTTRRCSSSPPTQRTTPRRGVSGNGADPPDQGTPRFRWASAGRRLYLREEEPHRGETLPPCPHPGL